MSDEKQIAIISPPRLPYHPEIAERFGVDKAGWRALVDAVFPLAKTPDAVVLALSYCKARHLDPFKRMVHIVPMWNSALGREVETVWPGIGEHRATAMRTGQYGGCDPTNFGPMVQSTFTGRVKTGKNEWGDVSETVRFPEWAQVTVYRVVQGQRMPVPGPRVYWLETYSKRGKAEVPNDRWCRAPSQMIEKCAEAAALRKAFPEELGDTMSAEEAEGRETDVTGAADQIKDVTPPRPTRAEFVEPEAVKPEPDADELNAKLDAEYAATMSGRVPDDPPKEPEPVKAERPKIEDKYEGDCFDLAEREAKKGLPPLESWFRAQTRDIRAAVAPHLPWLKALAARVDNGEIVE